MKKRFQRFDGDRAFLGHGWLLLRQSQSGRRNLTKAFTTRKGFTHPRCARQLGFRSAILPRWSNFMLVLCRKEADILAYPIAQKKPQWRFKPSVHLNSSKSSYFTRRWFIDFKEVIPWPSQLLGMRWCHVFRSKWEMMYLREDQW